MSPSEHATWREGGNKEPSRAFTRGEALRGKQTMQHRPPRTANINAGSKRALPAEPPPQFSLGTLFGVVTLLSLNLALFVKLPVYGITLAMALWPAVFRTWAIVQMRRELQQPIRLWPAFKTSFALVTLLGALGLGGIAIAVLPLYLALMYVPVVAIYLMCAVLGVAVLLPLVLYVLLFPRRVRGRYTEYSPWI